ncbi:MAG: transposase [Cocleimonas sp.]|nr:transposase [Cocleimonas sp.]
MVSALTTSGLPASFNDQGTMTGGVFLYFLRYVLCPLLSDGDSVVMDNASVHKVADVKKLIKGDRSKHHLLTSLSS